jgi:outer membrane lipoprotein-sorting protein
LSPAFSQQDPAARNILDKVGESVKNHKTITADFRFITVDLQTKSESTREGVLFLKDEKYRLEYDESVTYFNGKTLWNHLVDMEEVTITEPDPNSEDILSNPRKLFNYYDEDFKFRYMGRVEDNGKSYDEIELVPKVLTQAYSKIKLLVRTDPSEIYSVHYFGKEGFHYIVEITEMVANKPMSDAFFRFNPEQYPDVEVIDMRF